MSVTLYEVQAFTDSDHGGNPAGVVLNADELGLTTQGMQHIAALAGFSETAFVLKSDVADYCLRFFTPSVEVDLCGHATIGTFWFLNNEGLIQKNALVTQETRSGILKIQIGEEGVLMEQAAPVFGAVIEPEDVLWSLGLTEEALLPGLPVQIVSTGMKDILIPVASVEILKQIEPDYEEITRISKALGVVGYHVFAMTSEIPRRAGAGDVSADLPVTAWCRNFAPLYGIDEESATGTSNGALAAYLTAYGAVKSESFIFKQGMWMDNESRINVHVKSDPLSGEVLEVWVGGKARLAKIHHFD